MFKYEKKGIFIESLDLAPVSPTTRMDKTERNPNVCVYKLTLF